MDCGACGAPLPDNARFCQYCGSPVPAAAPPSPPEETPAASPGAGPVGLWPALSVESQVASQGTPRPAQGRGLSPRAKIFWLGMALSVLFFAAVFAVALRTGDTINPGQALVSVLVGMVILLIFWFVVSGLLAMEEPLAEHGFRIYWIATVALTLLAVVVALLSIGSRTPRDYLQLASDITVNGCYALGAWGLLCWRWFLKRHWLLKMALAPFAFWIFVFPARAVVYVLFVGAFGIINAVAGAVIR